MATAEPAGAARGVDRVLFGGALVALALAALNQSMVAVAVPQIVGDLGGADRLSWLVTGYLLLMTVAIPLCGKVADTAGVRTVLLAATSAFAASCALGALSTSMETLALIRAVQGASAGGILVGVQIAIGQLAPPRERGRYMVAFTTTYGVGTLAGPLLGGAAVQVLSWRWIFVVSVPPTLLALAAMRRAARSPRRTRTEPLDLPGAALLTATLTALVLAVTWGGREHAWGSPLMTGLLAGAVLGLAAFVAVERRAAAPVVALGLLRCRTIGLSAAMGIIVGMAMFAAITFIPIFFQLVYGLRPAASGLWSLPLEAGVLTGGVWAARTMRRRGRYRGLIITGMGVLLVGAIITATLGAQGAMVPAAVAMLLLGAGVTLAMQALVVAVQVSAPPENLGAATSLNALTRTLGGALGIAVYGKIFSTGLANGLQGLPPEIARRLGGGADVSPQALDGLTGPGRDAAVAAIADALHAAFLFGAGLALVAFLLAWLVPDGVLDQEASRSPAGEPVAGRGGA